MPLGRAKGDLPRTPFGRSSQNTPSTRFISRLLIGPCFTLKDAMSSANTPLKVMLVEDHLSFRQALAYLLSDDPELEVAAQAASVAEAREVLDGGDLDGGLDVALLDLALPDGDGRDLIGDLRRSSPGIRIMVLSATVWSEDVEDVLRAGAEEVRDKIMSYWSLAEEVRRLGGGR